MKEEVSSSTIRLLSPLSAYPHLFYSKDDIEERLSPVAYPLREHFTTGFLEDDKLLYEPDFYARTIGRDAKACGIVWV